MGKRDLGAAPASSSWLPSPSAAHSQRPAKPTDAADAQTLQIQADLGFELRAPGRLYSYRLRALDAARSTNRPAPCDAGRSHASFSARPWHIAQPSRGFVTARYSMAELPTT